MGEHALRLLLAKAREALAELRVLGPELGRCQEPGVHGARAADGEGGTEVGPQAPVGTDTDVIDVRQGVSAASQDRYAEDPIGAEVVEEWTEDDDEDAWSLTDRR